MIWFAILIFIMLAIILGLQAYAFLAMRRAQKIYDEQVRHEQPTLWDLREVLLEGDKDLAVQMYCDIFHIKDIDLARKEVEEFARHITR